MLTIKKIWAVALSDKLMKVLAKKKLVMYVTSSLVGEIVSTWPEKIDSKLFTIGRNEGPKNEGYIYWFRDLELQNVRLISSIEKKILNIPVSMP